MASSPGMPSLWRRIVVTALYLLPLTLVAALIWLGVATSTSDKCMLGGPRWCSITELAWLNGVVIGWVILVALCLVLGWRGHLWGARRRAETA